MRAFIQALLNLFSLNCIFANAANVVKKLKKIANNIYRWVRRIVYFLILLVLLLSGIIHSVWFQSKAGEFAENLCSQWIQREVSIGKLEFGFFSKSFVLKDVRILDYKNKPIIEVESAYIRLRSYDFKGVKIENLYLERPKIYINKYKGDTASDFKIILKKIGGEEKDSIPQNSTLIHKIRVNEGRFSYHNYNTDALYDGRTDFKHIDVTLFNLNVESLTIYNKRVIGKIISLNAKEQSGVVVEKMSAWVGVFPTMLTIKKLNLKTPQSYLKSNVSFDYKKFKDFKNFDTKVNMSVDIKPTSYVHTKDIGFFATAMQKINQKINISGRIDGSLKNISADELDIEYGKKTKILADIKWNGFPDLTKGYIDADIKNLYVDKSDLEHIKQFTNGEWKIPEILYKIEYAGVIGKFKGNLEKFDTDLEVLSNVGDMRVNIQAVDTLKDKKFFTGLFAASNLDVGVLSGIEPMLGKVNVNVYVSGLGEDYKKMHYTLDGSLSDLEIMGKALDVLHLNCETHTGYFHGELSCRDTNLSFDFDGLLNYENNNHIAQYDLSIKNIDLQALGLTKDTIPFKLSGDVESRYTGSNFDDFLGSMDIYSLNIQRMDNEFNIPYLKVNTTTIDEGRTRTQVLSDFLNIRIEGLYKISKFPYLYEYILSDYVPGIRNENGVREREAVESTDNQNFDLSIAFSTFKDPISGEIVGINSLLKLFVPSLLVDENMDINFKYNAPEHDYDLDLSASYIGFGSLLCTNGEIKLSTIDKQKLKVSTSADMLYLNDSLHIDRFEITADFDGKDTVLWNIGWINRIDTISFIKSMGNISGAIDFSYPQTVKILIAPSHFIFAGTPWTTIEKANIELQKGRMLFENIGLYSDNMEESIMLEGLWSQDTSSEINLSFNAFNMDYLEVFTKKTGMSIDANISGKLKIKDPVNSFNFIADIVLDDLFINGGDYGRASLLTSFNRGGEKIEGQLIIGQENISTPYMNLKGYIDVKNKGIDMKGELTEMPSEFVSGFLKSFASDITGTLSGPLEISGPLKNMNWKATVESKGFALTIKMLQTRYAFDNLKLELTPKAIVFKESIIKDVDFGSTGMFKGQITHNYFKNIALDLNLRFSDMLVLNTTASKEEVYYGRVFATGLINITGSLSAINIGVKAKTDRNSYITFDFSSSAGSSNSGFVSFKEVEKEDSTFDNPILYFKRVRKEAEKGKLILDLGIDVTPDLRVGLELRNTTMNGSLSSVGQGNIRMLVNPGGSQLFGTYIINEGNFDFSMIDLINKRFSLKQGGTITWTGPMTDARLNIDAAYTTRTSLFPVLANSDIDETVLKKKVAVESIIDLQGNLMNPDITFDINLVNVEEDTKDLFFSYVNKENEDEMIKQTFSLLMFNSFMSTGENAMSSSLSNSALVSSSELLFNQFNNFLSHLSSNFNLGMNYTPASEMNNSEFQVMMSGQLFDDRLQIDGNIGVSEADKATAKSASTIVGDINVEWKFTEQLRLRAFNRSNDKELTKPGTSYTQGVGFVFRRDFDSVKELFSRIGPTKEERKERRKQKKEAKRKIGEM